MARPAKPKVKTHRKLENESYVLEIQLPSKEIISLSYPPNQHPDEISDQEYETMQLRETKALITDSSEDKGERLSTEGKIL